MTLTRRLARYVPVLAAALAFGLAPAAEAHRPSPGLAAAVFNSKTSGMCPGGSNGGRCDRYGSATCGNWGNHSRRCIRYANDYRTIFNLRYRFRAVGIVDHAPRVVHWNTTRVG